MPLRRSSISHSTRYDISYPWEFRELTADGDRILISGFLDRRAPHLRTFAVPSSSRSDRSPPIWTLYTVCHQILVARQRSARLAPEFSRGWLGKDCEAVSQAFLAFSGPVDEAAWPHDYHELRQSSERKFTGASSMSHEIFRPQ